ncbi:MAG: amidohydrolase family protein [Gemmatimonadota bacterium]
MTTLVPELLWRDGRFEAGLAVVLDPETGQIRALIPATDVSDDALHLPARALLPGFVNAHSHAFQRLLRGRTQWRPADQPHADFWSWRQAMYAAAGALEPAEVEAVARFCFVEMLRAGWTAVGEFHYLHMQPNGAPYADPNELALRVLAAARSAGIRIRLLNVCYATGGIGAPLAPEQRRFAAPTREAFLERTASLLAAVGQEGGGQQGGGQKGDGQSEGGESKGGQSKGGQGLATVGVAPHSVRAVPRAWLGELAAWARARAVPLHVHAAEQPAEVAACLEAYGVRPVALLDAEGALGGDTTVVHATHLDQAEIQALAASGATVCACPTTERDLGDGILPAAELLAAGVPLALGTDSQSVIDPFDEMRSLEYHERLRSRRRVVLARADHDRLAAAPALLEAASAGGARALGLHAGKIEPGALADLVSVELEHRALAGWSPDTLAPLLALSGPLDAVRDVWVGGVHRVVDGVHPLEAEAQAAFRDVACRRGGA